MYQEEKEGRKKNKLFQFQLILEIGRWMYLPLKTTKTPLTVKTVKM